MNYANDKLTASTSSVPEPDFRAMRIDETGDWADSIRAMLKGGKIWAVYVFDKNQVTYCCEMTPSYCMHLVEYYGEMGDGTQTSDELNEDIQSAGIDEPISYIHCSGIDKLAEDKFVKIALDGPYDPEAYDSRDAWYEEELQSAIEYARCNSLI
jgi:hypothetical protein